VKTTNLIKTVYCTRTKETHLLKGANSLKIKTAKIQKTKNIV